MTHNPRIGIESSILTRSRAGIGFYTDNLVRCLADLPGDEEYTLLYNRPLPQMDLPARMRHSLHGPRSTHLWAQTRLSSICRGEKIDLLHSPGQGIPLLYDGPSILTIHDLSPLLFPQQKDITSRLIWNSLVPIMARRADHIITVSDNTKRDVIDLLGIAEHKITRIHEAAASSFYPEPDEECKARFRRDKHLEPGYILAVGTLEPRKKYPFLFKLFAKWLENSNPDATLVVVGKDGWLYDEIYETFESLNLQRHVRFEGYVGDLDLMRMYYSAAQFSILTPQYEGFWLPGLESMACGTPVIAPNQSSITEVAGKAGLLIDTWDYDEWMAAMDRLWMTDEREIWSKKGIERAKDFSWEQAAKETLDVYRSVLQT